MRITRTGHVITWENRGRHLTEVTAAADQPLPENRRLRQHRLRGEHSPPSLRPPADYQTSFQVEALPPEIFLHVHDEILRDGASAACCTTSSPTTGWPWRPLGFVTVEAWAGCLFFSTFHTFPDEHTVVKTQSLIERKG